ncbi:MAG: alpha/beta hydrolase fold protein [Bacteroidota bacterium]|nr:alpha/beta hydrolase fold protein [Bacteroidota bacterium]
MKTNIEYTASTVPTQFISVNGTPFAYRRFGNKAGLPLVHLQHFTGTMENWDPKVLDALALDREIIIFNNRGVASTGGETPDSIAAIAQDAAAFIDALGLKKIDLLGFSMGGMVAQQITLDRPELINKLILLGTAPRGGHEIDDFTPEVWAIFAKEFPSEYEILLETLFSPTSTSQQAAHEFLSRVKDGRTENRDSKISEQVAPAQSAAIKDWANITPGDYTYLKAIKQPVFVLTGHNDIIFPTVNSFLLQQNLPDAQLIIYPDSNHGAQYQFPELFVKQLTAFLEGIK